MAVDTTGNLYVAHLGTSHVLVLNPKGKLIKQLPGGNYDVSNLVFGGKDLNELFITGSIGYRSNTAGPGVPSGAGRSERQAVTTAGAREVSGRPGGCHAIGPAASDPRVGGRCI